MDSETKSCLKNDYQQDGSIIQTCDNIYIRRNGNNLYVRMHLKITMINVLKLKINKNGKLLAGKEMLNHQWRPHAREIEDKITFCLLIGRDMVALCLYCIMYGQFENFFIKNINLNMFIKQTLL